MAEYTIGSPEDFPENRGTSVTVDGLDIAVFNFDGELHAVSDYCPHKGAPLSVAGEQVQPAVMFPDVTRGDIDPENRTVSCPWHKLEFELESGECPAADFAIRVYDVQVEGDKVTISL